MLTIGVYETDTFVIPHQSLGHYHILHLLSYPTHLYLPELATIFTIFAFTT